MNTLQTFNFLALSIGFTVMAYAQPTGNLTPASTVAAAGPIERTLTDMEGRTIEGSILARKGDNIRFRRKSDGKEFPLTANKLSPADREFVTSLPEGDFTKTAKAPAFEPINTEKKVFLTLPFEKQARGGICTAAALLNVIQYVDPTIKIDQEEMFLLFSSGRSGANYPEMESALRSLSYDSAWVTFKGNEDLTLTEIHKSLSANIPVLAATSSHMVTVVGFDSTNPEKKTLTVWDQRASKEGAKDLESLGVVAMEEKDFLKKFKSVILINPNPKMVTKETKQIYGIAGAILKTADPKANVYTLTPPENQTNMEEYLDHIIATRITLELRRKQRVFFYRSESTLLEITEAPNPKDKSPKWGVKSLGGNIEPMTHDDVIRAFRNNKGVLYTIPHPPAPAK